jgi:hypothetical protein
MVWKRRLIFYALLTALPDLPQKTSGKVNSVEFVKILFLVEYEMLLKKSRFGVEIQREESLSRD